MADKKISQLTSVTTPVAGTEELAVVQSGDTKKATIDQVLVRTENVTRAGGFTSLGVGIGALSDGTNAKIVTNGGLVTYAGSISAAPTAESVVLDQQSGGAARLMSSGAGTWDSTLAINPYGGKVVIGGTTGGDVGSLTLANGNLVIGTSGKGIDFSADGQAAGMTSELLDDYEEGTFTATLTGYSAPPTTPVTVTSYYTKVGRQVTCQIAFSNVDTTGASGPMLIQGLPFTAANTAAVGVCQLSMGTVVGVAMLFPGQTTIEILDATFYNNLSIAAGAGKYAFVTITYTV